MTGAVEGRNDIDVVFLTDVEDLDQLSGGQILVGVGIHPVVHAGEGGVVGPGLGLTAAEPAEVIFRLIVAFHIVSRIPQVGPVAAVFRNVQLQGVVAHPGHFLDEVADVFLGQVFTGAVQLNGTLPGVGGVVGGEALDGVGLAVAEVLLQVVQTVEQTVHILSGDGGVVGDHDLVALDADVIIAADDLNEDIAGPKHGGIAPHDVHRSGGGDAVGGKLALGQLHGLQQLAGRLSGQEEAAVGIEGKDAAVGLEIVHQLTHIGGIGRSLRRHHEDDAHQQNQGQNHGNAPFGEIQDLLFHNITSRLPGYKDR